MRRFVGAAAAGILTLGVASIGFIDHGPRPSVTDLALPTRVITPASVILPESEVPFGSAGGSSDLARGGFDSFGGSGSASGGTSSGTNGGSGTGSNGTGSGGNGGGTNNGGGTTKPPVTDPNPNCPLPAALCPPEDPVGLVPTLGLGLNLNGTPLGTEVVVNPTDPTSSTIGLNLGGTQVLGGAPAPTEPNTATLTVPLLGTQTLP